MNHNMEIPACWQEFEDVLNAGVDRVILFGPPGTGKTYAGLTAGDTTGGSFRLICVEDMTSASIEGMYKPNDNGTWSWHPGPAIRAWQGNGQNGGRLVADEIDKASGEVLGLFLAMTDSPESASWAHPDNNEIVRPLPGFSVVMTTNIEDMAELPDALSDRFPVSIRINAPHPAAFDALNLSHDLRPYAVRMADAGARRISLRVFAAFDKLRKTVGDERAAKIIFKGNAEAVLDAIRIDQVSAI